MDEYGVLLSRRPGINQQLKKEPSDEKGIQEKSFFEKQVFIRSEEKGFGTAERF